MSKYTIQTLISNVEDIAKQIVALNPTPIDIQSIIRTYNIVLLFKHDLPDNVSGMFIADKNNGFAIIIDANDYGGRPRFTMAHEFGHFISYKLQNKYGTKIDERSVLARQGTDPEEIFANKFAAELLMPKDRFMEKMKEFEFNIESLAKHFDVSKQAVSFRLTSILKE